MSIAALLTELRFEWFKLGVAVVTALMALPLILYVYLRRNRPARVRFSSLRNVAAARPSLKVRLRHLPLWLRLAALLLFLAAFAHPYLEREKPRPPQEAGREEHQQKKQQQRKKIQVPTEGISIQLLIDRSGSMGTFEKRDMFGRPLGGKTNLIRFEGDLMSKLEVVKVISQRFISGTPATEAQRHDSIFTGRGNDLVSLMTFARYPYLSCPLTLRHELLLDYISQTAVVRRQEEDGTYIGYALERALLQIIDTRNRAKAKNAYTVKSSIIILITDGEQVIRPEDQKDKHKSLTPVQAAAIAREHGIRVYTIGIMPRVIYDDSGTAYDTNMIRGANFDTGDLRKVAELTGGRFYRADSGATLANIYQDIDKLEKSKIPTRKELEVRVEKTKEKHKIETEVIQLFPALLWLGFGLFLLEQLLTELYFRRIP